MTTAVQAPCYVFGVVAAGTAVPAVDDEGPAQGLRLVEVDGLAAIVGNPPPDRPLGRAVDLLAHDRVMAAFLDSGATVLPLQFGAVVDSEATVIEEVLQARREQLLAELARVDGCVQYTVKVRYEQDVVLREVLAGHPEVAHLREHTRVDSAPSFEENLRLGELVVRALDELRSSDARTLVDALGPVADLHVREPAAPEDVLTAVTLVERARMAGFERRVEDLAQQHHPRLRVRLIGPSAAYDFVGTR